MKKEIHEFTTKELSEELEKREGVTRIWVSPYATEKIEVEGAAIVLINRD